TTGMSHLPARFVLLPDEAYLVQLCQERVDRVSTLFWLLAHPPMTHAFQNSYLCAGALGTTACERLPAAVMVFCRDQRQAGFGGCPWQAGPEVSQHRLRGRSVQRQDCSTQVPVRASNHLPGDRRGHAQALVPLGSDLGRRACHLRNRL